VFSFFGGGLGLLDSIEYILYKVSKEEMKKQKSFELPTTISETIYQYIKQAILSGDLRAKQRILEKQLANLYNVSQTPVREAIRRLSGEKYIIINARKEIIVAGASWKEVQELYEVVGFLDFPAVTKAMENMTEKDIENVSKMTWDLKNFMEMDKSDKYLDLTLAIHDKIWSFCGNKFLYETLCYLIEKISFFCKQGFSPYPEDAALQRSFEDHNNLVEAILNKDTEKLRDIISRHWYMPY